LLRTLSRNKLLCPLLPLLLLEDLDDAGFADGQPARPAGQVKHVACCHNPKLAVQALHKLLPALAVPGMTQHMQSRGTELCQTLKCVGVNVRVATQFGDEKLSVLALCVMLAAAAAEPLGPPEA
jgi:hypothetical protein